MDQELLKRHQHLSNLGYSPQSGIHNGHNDVYGNLIEMLSGNAVARMPCGLVRLFQNELERFQSELLQWGNGPDFVGLMLN